MEPNRRFRFCQEDHPRDDSVADAETGHLHRHARPSACYPPLRPSRDRKDDDREGHRQLGISDLLQHQCQLAD